jgi:hypothetical protein
MDFMKPTFQQEDDTYSDYYWTFSLDGFTKSKDKQKQAKIMATRRS